MPGVVLGTACTAPMFGHDRLNSADPSLVGMSELVYKRKWELFTHCGQDRAPRGSNDCMTLFVLRTKPFESAMRQMDA